MFADWLVAIEDFFAGFSSDYIIGGFAAAEFVLFIFALFFAIFSKKSTKKNRKWYIFALIPLFILEFALLGISSFFAPQAARTVTVGEQAFYPLVTLAVFFALYIIVYFLPEADKKDKLKQRELVALIDSELKRQRVYGENDGFARSEQPVPLDLSQTDFPLEELRPKNVDGSADLHKKNAKTECEADGADCETDGLDCSHVFNIIERLNAFPLSAQDRKKVRELELSVTAFKNNGAPNDREKLNDGLNELLKIMSKYNV